MFSYIIVCSITKSHIWYDYLHWKYFMHDIILFSFLTSPVYVQWYPCFSNKIDVGFVQFYSFFHWEMGGNQYEITTTNIGFSHEICCYKKTSISCQKDFGHKIFLWQLHEHKFCGKSLLLTIKSNLWQKVIFTEEK